MKIRGVIIQSSARKDGNTSKIISYLNKELQFDVINLHEYNIGHYRYELPNEEDDFRKLFIKIVKNYDCLVFATPIYWYTMSGHLKVFFDRISDFLKNEKHYARGLAGKTMAVISCGSDNEVFSGFLMPFEQTAIYLNMKLIGHEHTWILEERVPKEVKIRLDEFSDVISKLYDLKNLNKSGL